MTGEDLRALLNSLPHATLLKADNNEYLVSYRWDTGAEVAFDPRTTTKCSLFINKLPGRMEYLFPHIERYYPENPSTALKRVSTQLAEAPQLFKVDLPDQAVAARVLEWIRWA